MTPLPQQRFRFWPVKPYMRHFIYRECAGQAFDIDSNDDDIRQRLARDGKLIGQRCG